MVLGGNYKIYLIVLTQYFTKLEMKENAAINNSK